MKFATILALITMAVMPAKAADLRLCYDIGLGPENVVVSETGVTHRRFYRDEVMFLLIDTIEPAAAAYGVAVIYPDPENGMPVCQAAVGYSGIDLMAAKSTYDPSQGLTVIVPTKSYDADTGTSVPGDALVIKVNLATGLISKN